MTFLRLVCLYGSTSLFWVSPYFRMKASTRGACREALPGISGCLDVVVMDLRPPRGRHAPTALPDSLQLCLSAGCFYTPLFKTKSILFFFLDHQTGHAACFNARGLLYEFVFDLLIFYVASIYWKSTSCRSAFDLATLGKLHKKVGSELTEFFSWNIVHAIRPVDSFKTSSCLSRARYAYTSFRGLSDMGTPRSPPARLTAVPDKWVRPTRRPADLSVGLPDLTCGPKDEKIAWSTSQDSPSGLRQLG